MGRITCNDLPSECLLNIVKYLDLPDVAALLRTTKTWNETITSSEAVVYGRLASNYDSRMGLRSPHQLQDALETWASPHAASMQMQTWKQYCQLQAATEGRWRGELYPNYTLNFCESAQSGERVVQNIQVYSENSLLLVTELGNRGCIDHIVVRCLISPTHPTLFSLKTDHIIHSIKLSNGFLVCKTQETLSIWRWAEDQQRDPVPLEPAPWQTLMYERAMQLAGLQSEVPNRGELIPVANITRPQFSLYFLVRFVYPTLCLWSVPSDPIWFWDIKSRSFTQSITLNRNGMSMWHCPLDFNDTHIVAIPDKIEIYSRATGHLMFQLDYDCVDLSHRFPTSPVLSHDDLFEKCALANYPDLTAPPLPQNPPWPDRDRVREVHISPTGNDFVGIMRGGCIFHCVINQEPGRSHPSANTPEDTNFRMSFTRVQNKIWTAAYDGRRIVAYGPEGLSIVHLVDQPGPAITISQEDSPIQVLYPFPAKTMYHLSAFRAKRFGEHTRVELTRDTCWLTYSPPWLPNTRFRQTVGMLDFTKELEFTTKVAESESN